MSHALYEAYWSRNEDVDEVTVLQKYCTQFGVDPALANDERGKTLLTEYTDDAMSKGAFGVPTFFFGEQMFYGGDRLHLLEKVHKSGHRCIPFFSAVADIGCVSGSGPSWGNSAAAMLNTCPPYHT